MVTSDFRPEVEILPFRACTMKNTQYNAYLWPNRRMLVRSVAPLILTLFDIGCYMYQSLSMPYVSLCCIV